MRLDIMATGFGNEELLGALKRLAAEEKKIQYQFLCYLSEVDRRKLYAIEGYPSLFTFLTDYLGYSESSALKRSQIVRKAKRLPKLYFAIEEGRLSLSAASRLCPFLSHENFEKLVSECERKSVREVEKILVKYFPKEEIQDFMKQKVTPLSIDQVSVKFTATTGFEEKLKKAQALLSHKYPEGKIGDILSDALDSLLKELEPKRLVKKVQANIPRGISNEDTSRERSLDTRYIPRAVRREIWQRDQEQCSYVSPKGKRCEAKRFLHIDHIKPWVLGGSSHDENNLRLLCSEHNRLRIASTFPHMWQRVSQ